MLPPPRLFDNQKHQTKLQKIGCHIPAHAFQIYVAGHVSNCCYTWLPTFVGNICDETLLEMTQNQISKKLKESVKNGCYNYCDTTTCPDLSKYLHQDKLTWPLYSLQEPQSVQTIDIYFNYDQSCNLQCPSCRNEKLLYKKNQVPANLMKVHERVEQSVQELLDNGYRLNLNLTGSGDPFASVLYWDYLKNFQSHDEVRITLQTNGVLMTPERFQYDYAKSIRYVNVSVDAVTEETYNKVRKGGHFTQVKKNLIAFDQMVKEGFFPKLDGWQVNFILQNDNFSELPQFCEWAMSFESMTAVWCNLIADWGHLKTAEFQERAVWNKAHPNHENFLKTLENPILKNSKINLGNLSQFCV